MKSTGYAAGGKSAESHSDKMADEKMIKRAIAEHDSQLHPGHHTRVTLKRGGFAEGGMAASRMDQRGRGGKKHPTSQVNVVVAPPRGGPGPMPIPMPMRPPMAAPPVAPPPAMPPRPMPPAGGMPMAGGMGAPGMPPAGMPGGMPPRPMIKTGGNAENGKGGEGAHFTGGGGGGTGRREKADRDDDRRY